eukprot:c21600_g1_i1.p1 GENE.c21600_g1_i1~~c21600_g1_i1.p1  ORF type:complete len:439 (-),score=108.57 c21600_g1_i1:66-1382(-)
MGKIWLPLIFLFYFFSWTHSLHVGVINWNLGRRNSNKLREQGLDQILSSVKLSPSDPEVIVVNFQEGEGNVVKSGSLYGNDIPGYLRYSVDSAYSAGGTIRTDVYFKISLMSSRKVKLEKKKIFDQLFAFPRRDRITIQQSFTIQISSKKVVRLCVLNSHFHHKIQKAKDNNNLEHFIALLKEFKNNQINIREELRKHRKDVKRSETIRKDMCDFWVWSGDFNFRTETHQNRVLNNIFKENEIYNIFRSIRIPDNGIIEKKDKKTDEWLFLSEKLFSYSERDHRNAESIWSNFPNYPFPPFDEIPPTYSKINKLNCEGEIIKNPHQTNEFKFPSSRDKKYPICLPTKLNGNCQDVTTTTTTTATHQNLYCMAADRPVSWTDMIFSGIDTEIYEIPVYKKYGGYYGPSLSDHVPIFAVIEFVEKNPTAVMLEDEIESLF